MNFRYSAINTAYRCLRRYQIEYIEGVRNPPSSDMEFGTALHLALSNYLENKDAEFAIRCFHDYWKTCANMAFGRDSWQALSDKAEVFFSRWVRLHAKKYTPKYVEQEMRFTLGNHKFVGTADFIGEYEGIPSVVDFKTSGPEYGDRKILTNEQMLLYAHAAKQVYGYNVEQIVYVVFIKSQDRIQVKKRAINAEMLKKELDNVILMCDDLKGREQFPKNKNSCEKCDHFNRCYSEAK